MRVEKVGLEPNFERIQIPSGTHPNLLYLLAFIDRSRKVFTFVFILRDRGERIRVRLSILANQVTDRGHLCGRSGRCSFQDQLIGNRLFDNGTLEEARYYCACAVLRR